MARGRKTGGRQKGTPNKSRALLDAQLAEASARLNAGLLPSNIASMTPLEVMLHAMHLEAENGRWQQAAAIAEKASPYVHPRLAPRVEGGGDITITIVGGLPD